MILIAGGIQDYESESIEGLVDKLYSLHKEYEFLYTPDRFPKEALDDQISRTNVFIILVGSELDSSAWLNGCLEGVCKDITKKVYGIKLDRFEIPTCSKHLENNIEITTAKALVEKLC